MQVRGCLFLDRPMNQDLHGRLAAYCLTRHYKRGGEDDGLMALDPDDKDAPDWRALYGRAEWRLGKVPRELLDYSTVARGAPSLYCHWRPSDDRMGLEFDGCEKADCMVAWLRFLIRRFVKPAGHVLNGEVEMQWGMMWKRVQVRNNRVHVVETMIKTGS